MPRIVVPIGSPLRCLFKHRFLEPVIGEDDVGPVADQQVSVDRLSGAGDDRIDLLEERLRIDHDPGGDDRGHPRMQDAGRQQRQLVGLAVEDDRVAGVVAPL